MMILGKREILERIRRKEIVITPFKRKNLQAASLDLVLGNEFRIFKPFEKVPVSESFDLKKITELKKGSVVLGPFDFVLGITKEKIKLPGNVAGFLSTRSRFARLGLSVNLNSPVVQPGVDNKQVLEIFNASRNTLILKHGEKICQLFFMDVKGNGKYNGRFRNQLSL